MTLTNLLQKLTSRKFWAGLAGFVAPLLVLFHIPESEITTVTALITSSGALIAYIFAETSVDMTRQNEDEGGKEDYE